MSAETKCPFCQATFFAPGHAPVPGEYEPMPLPPADNPNMELAARAKAALAAKTTAPKATAAPLAPSADPANDHTNQPSKNPTGG